MSKIVSGEFAWEVCDGEPRSKPLCPSAPPQPFKFGHMRPRRARVAAQHNGSRNTATDGASVLYRATRPVFVPSPVHTRTHTITLMALSSNEHTKSTSFSTRPRTHTRACGRRGTSGVQKVRHAKRMADYTVFPHRTPLGVACVSSPPRSHSHFPCQVTRVLRRAAQHVHARARTPRAFTHLAQTP